MGRSDHANSAAAGNCLHYACFDMSLSGLERLQMGREAAGELGDYGESTIVVNNLGADSSDSLAGYRPEMVLRSAGAALPWIDYIGLIEFQQGLTSASSSDVVVPD